MLKPAIATNALTNIYFVEILTDPSLSSPLVAIFYSNNVDLIFVLS